MKKVIVLKQLPINILTMECLVMPNVPSDYDNVFEKKDDVSAALSNGYLSIGN